MARLQGWKCLLVAMVAWSARHPYWTLLWTIGLAAGALGVAWQYLEYRPQRDDLLSADKPCQQRWQRYIDRFGPEEEIVVVISGADVARRAAAVEAVATRIAAQPQVFDRLFYKVDLRPLRSRALLYLSLEELERLRQMLHHLQPLLGEQASWSWRLLSLQTLLARAEAAMQHNSPSPYEVALLTSLPKLLQAAVAFLQGQTPPDPWGQLYETSARQQHWALALEQPQYLHTPDGTMTVLLCRPVEAGRSPVAVRQTIALLRAMVQDVASNFADLEFGVTGLPVLESDEMAQADRDTRWAALVALLGVAVLYGVVYRGLRYPLLTLATLLVGILWALGWATLTIGHLNILSAAFAVMMIGVGDYGVLWVARYDEARRAGLIPGEAIAYAARTAGPGILTAAATTAAAFGALLAVDFRAVAELGWIAGWGILLCALSCFTLLPALLVLTQRTERMVQPSGALGGMRPFNIKLSPWMIALVAAALVMILGGGMWNVRYDHNLLHLQSTALESVQWELRLTQHAAGMTWDALSIAETAEEARLLRQRYEGLPQVGRVLEVASLLPADMERKLPIVQEIHRQLLRLPTSIPPPAVAVDPERIARLTARLATSPAASPAIRQGALQLNQLLTELPQAAQILRELDRWLSSQLAKALHQWQVVSQPLPITLTDIPEPLRERYVSRDGAFLVQVWAKDDLWDYTALERFLRAVNAVDPEATGKTFRTYEGLRQMHRGFLWASLYALGVVAGVLWLDFRCGRYWLAALFPLFVGLVMTVGTMGWCGVSWNPANVVALPLLIGIGIDNGVHVLHDYLQGIKSNIPWRLGRAVARGIVVAGMTTLIGFATLTVARHRGIASLGWVMTVGVGWCLFAALVFLPALLQIGQQMPRLLAAQRWMPRWHVGKQ
ncbi:MAG: MMPL family transporter [Gemmataceae bacterium]|nr:MMPL family transporter [Gemmataceae bacterium]